MPKVPRENNERLADKAPRKPNGVMAEGRFSPIPKTRNHSRGRAKEEVRRHSASARPLFRRTENYLSDAPLLLNGKVPVHESCDGCKAWLEAYAKIANGRFAGIVEVEVDGEEKELVIIKPEATAKTLREEFERRLSHLQESCAHEKAEWMNVKWAPGHSLGTGLVCLRCEKVLQTRK